MDAEADPAILVRRLVDLLTIEPRGDDLFHGRRLIGGEGRVFGGQVIAQGLMAAMQTVPADRPTHSLHAYFLRPGSEDHPIDYRVTRDRDGGSFSARRVVALQQDVPILTMAASFQTIEPGYEHQAAMPDVPPPEGLQSQVEHWRAREAELPAKLRRRFLRPRPVEVRPVHPRGLQPEKREPVNHIWFRAVAPLGQDPNLHRAVLTYASDMNLLGTGMLPHGLGWTSPGLQMASLDHALWMHGDFRADEWLLYAAESPWAGRARSVNRGLVFTRDGRLVASVAQEGLMRDRSLR